MFIIGERCKKATVRQKRGNRSEFQGFISDEGSNRTLVIIIEALLDPKATSEVIRARNDVRLTWRGGDVDDGTRVAAQTLRQLSCPRVLKRNKLKRYEI